jgi:2,4-dienoyl-CoA reductase-like NADH-dependent reductase (Old Yellow Enzyme family)
MEQAQGHQDETNGRRLKVKDPLLQPLQIKKLTLKNRIMSTSHACGLEVDGIPKEQYQRYHEEKAIGGIALTMFGGSSNVAVDSPSVFRQLYVGDDAIIPYLQQFSERIHAQGAALMCQITHLDRSVRNAAPPAARRQFLRASMAFWRRNSPTPRRSFGKSGFMSWGWRPGSTTAFEPSGNLAMASSRSWSTRSPAHRWT